MYIRDRSSGVGASYSHSIKEVENLTFYEIIMPRTLIQSSICFHSINNPEGDFFPLVCGFSLH